MTKSHLSFAKATTNQIPSKIIPFPSFEHVFHCFPCQNVHSSKMAPSMKAKIDTAPSTPNNTKTSNREKHCVLRRKRHWHIPRKLEKQTANLYNEA